MKKYDFKFDWHQMGQEDDGGEDISIILSLTREEYNIKFKELRNQPFINNFSCTFLGESCNLTTKNKSTN